MLNLSLSCFRAPLGPASSTSPTQSRLLQTLFLVTPRSNALVVYIDVVFMQAGTPELRRHGSMRHSFGRRDKQTPRRAIACVGEAVGGSLIESSRQLAVAFEAVCEDSGSWCTGAERQKRKWKRNRRKVQEAVESSFRWRKSNEYDPSFFLVSEESKSRCERPKMVSLTVIERAAHASLFQTTQE